MDVWGVSGCGTSNDSDSERFLHKLQLAVDKTPSPADCGISPGPGDDTYPANSIKPGKLNGIASMAVANVGFSSADEIKKIFPFR